MPKLLDRVSYYIGFHNIKNTVESGATEVEAFLTNLAIERRVSASTQNQALAALLFLYRDVMSVDLPWLENLRLPKNPVTFRSC